jgi:hypothetical protein
MTMIVWTTAEAVRLLDGGMVTGMRARCFRCGEPVSPPLVVWVGADGDDEHDSTVIALHPKCSELVGADLIHDGDKEAQGRRGDYAEEKSGSTKA